MAKSSVQSKLKPKITRRLFHNKEAIVIPIVVGNYSYKKTKKYYSVTVYSIGKFDLQSIRILVNF